MENLKNPQTENPNTMKNSYITLFILLIATACGSPENSDLDAKKKELEDSKKQVAEMKVKISQLEKEIAAADPTSINANNTVLVAPYTLEKIVFNHFVEMRGTVVSRRNVAISSQAGGKIVKVHVSEGAKVSKGQVLVSLDADILYSTIGETKTQLELAKTVFEKQERLWKEKIGTELQYLQAKNQKESLEQRLAATNAQLDQMILRAPFGGTVDKVDALEGEMASPGIPLVRLVNQDDLYISVDVSENYIGRFSTGDKSSVYLPAQDKKVQSTVKSISQVINSENRTFAVEVTLPSGLSVKPNQVAMVELRDYSNPSTFVVPTKLIQRDNKGQYVFIAEKKGDVTLAAKAYITPGFSYESLTEIKEGLTGTEVVISEGYRDVTAGAEINIVVPTASKN